MMNNVDLHTRLKSVLDELGKEVEILSSYGREDKKRVKNILSNEYISLAKYFEENSVPDVYQNQDLKRLLVKIINRKNDLEKLRKGYSRVKSLRERIESKFNIAVKETLSYKQLQYLLETMLMYLNYERIEEYKLVLDQFLHQEQELENLPNKKAQYIIGRLAKLRERISEIKSEEKKERLNKRIEELIILDPNELISEKKNIPKLREAVDEIISSEFQKKNRKNLISGVRYRLLGNSSREVDSKDFRKQLADIKKIFKENWLQEKSIP